MTNDHDTQTRIVVSWLRGDAHENAERVLLAALDEVDHTRQRRSWWPAWRFLDMNNVAKILVAAAAVVAVAVVAINLLPGRGSGTGSVPPTPSMSPTVPPSPSMNPTPEPTASLVAHSLRPCCYEDDPRFDSMTFAIMAPPSWGVFEESGVLFDNDPPAGAYFGLYGGGNLFSEPCLTDEDAGADVPVGPTVDDFVTALVDHPTLDVTDPVDVTLAGYSGTYLDLTIPDDISECVRYVPTDRHIYAQGPGQRWHMWILDVDGTRVLVETNDYPGTSAETLAEEQAIVESLVITP
ncbi:MAG: hypothetical protein EPO36_05855 [Chloroflexota bacterium]|nr:MAG: hypothetical protein EPO36_05855 [Chloroflexota bacterium]